MQEDKPVQESPVSGSRFSRRSFPVSRKAIVIIIIAVVIVGGAVAAFFFYSASIKKTNDSTNATTAAQKAVAATKAAHQTSVEEQQVKINALIGSSSAGTGSGTATTQDPHVIAQADAIAQAQVDTANQSGDDDYIVSAALAQADLLINTDRAQEAIDSVLLPLEQKYGSNDAYKYQIDSYLGQAYAAVGNTDKANGYYNIIPAAEGN